MPDPTTPPTPPPTRRLSACRSCRAAVIWVRTALGKTMPVDAEPTALGNLDLGTDGIARVVPEGERHGLLYRSHFSTCPQAGSYRRK